MTGPLISQSEWSASLHMKGRVLIQSSVFMASGLIALADDCIKRRWHQKNRVQMTVPTLMKSPLRLNMEYVGPKRLMDEVFNRRERPRRPTPLREMTC